MEQWTVDNINDDGGCSVSNKRNSGRTTRMLLMALSRAGEAKKVYILFATRREEEKSSSWFRHIAKQVGNAPLVVNGTEYFFFHGAFPNYIEDAELFTDHSVTDATDAKSVPKRLEFEGRDFMKDRGWVPEEVLYIKRFLLEKFGE